VEWRSAAAPVAVESGAKRLLAAALLDECETDSGREKYISQLQRSIPVHVFGRCGVPCPGATAREEDCLSYLAQHYTFLLVFESHLCQHFHSSLVWSVLETTDLIPVVFGGVDYGRLLPSSSFVDALEHSPESLAAHLLALSADAALLARLRSWRLAGRTWTRTQWPCKLCEMLLLGREAELRNKPEQAVSVRCTSWPQLNFT
jgi:hypothetical protein